ncbi:MAG TPA: TolC family protein [Vicinamibacterales bacterium]|nr:TolC family protein [Vicinamibacterales bacterium]
MHERFRGRSIVSWAASIALGGGLIPVNAAAQSVPPTSLSLSDAIQLAVTNYPAIKESHARAQAADAGVGVARTAYLPRLDLVWQENRATHNNVFGLLFPQSVVPPISGPVLGTRSYDSVWGSAAGAQLSWEAVDFGQRKAGVDVAQTQSAAARAQHELTQLDVAAAAADAFLTVVASDEVVRADQANVDRLQVFANTVRTLVANQLRPGADESRANAELAIAKNQLSLAVQTAEIARAALADAVGAAGRPIEPAVTGLTTLPTVPAPGTIDVKTHPAARVEAAAIDTIRARDRVLARSYFPRVDLESAFAARNSGASVPGQPLIGDALWPQVPNWAVGVSVTFPAFDLFRANAQRQVEAQNEVAERARYEQITQSLTTQNARAEALLKAALEIAHNTPVERDAATEGESQARARYQNGLANVTEVAEAQRLLAQAEADDAVARLGVWRALLAAAQARGDLTPFLDNARRP